MGFNYNNHFMTKFCKFTIFIRAYIGIKLVKPCIQIKSAILIMKIFYKIIMKFEAQQMKYFSKSTMKIGSQRSQFHIYFLKMTQFRYPLLLLWLTRNTYIQTWCAPTRTTSRGVCRPSPWSACARADSIYFWKMTQLWYLLVAPLTNQKHIHTHKHIYKLTSSIPPYCFWSNPILILKFYLISPLVYIPT